LIKPKRNIAKIGSGIILILATGNSVPLYLSGSSQANGSLMISFLIIIGGFYLLYKGIYPSGK
jgi:hypothetical protein